MEIYIRRDTKCFLQDGLFFSSFGNMFPYILKQRYIVVLLHCVTLHIGFPWLVRRLDDGKLQTVALSHSTSQSACSSSGCQGNSVKTGQACSDISPKISLSPQRFTAQ